MRGLDIERLLRRFWQFINTIASFFTIFAPFHPLMPKLCCIWMVYIECYRDCRVLRIASFDKGPSIKDIRLFGPFFDLPTYPSPIFSYRNHCFSIVISDFWKPTYLPKNRISFVDAPLALLYLVFDFAIEGLNKISKGFQWPKRGIARFFLKKK